MFSRDVGRIVWEIMGPHLGVKTFRNIHLALSVHCRFETVDDLRQIKRIFQINLGVYDNSPLAWVSLDDSIPDKEELIMTISSDPSVDPASRNNLALREAVDYGSKELVAHLMSFPCVDPVEKSTANMINSRYLTAMTLAASKRRDDLIIAMMTELNVRTAIETCTYYGCHEALNHALTTINTAHIPADWILRMILRSDLDSDLDPDPDDDTDELLCRSLEILIDKRYDDLFQWFQTNKLESYGNSISIIMPILIQRFDLTIDEHMFNKIVRNTNKSFLFKMLRTYEHDLKMSDVIRQLDDKFLECFCNYVFIGFEIRS